MKRGISVLSRRPLPEDSQVIQPDKPNPTLERVQATAVMVQAHTEVLPQQCREECSKLEQKVATTVRRLVRRLTVERPLPQTEN
jgi:hypothetical protein